MLRSLHIQDLDWVVISVGQSVEQSLNVTLNVQELGGPKILVKASNEEHRKILQRLGVDRALVPETDAAVMAAHQLTYPGMLDLIPKYGGIAIQELRVDHWDGKTLVDLNLMQRFNVMVMGIRRWASVLSFSCPRRARCCIAATPWWWRAGRIPWAICSRRRNLQ